MKYQFLRHFFENNFAPNDRSDKRRIVRWSFTFFIIGAFEGAITLTGMPKPGNSLKLYFIYFSACTFIPLIAGLIGIFRATKGVERQRHLRRMWQIQFLLTTSGLILNKLLEGYVVYVAVILFAMIGVITSKLMKRNTI